MEVILSIKPQFATKIFEGSKKFEFRKTIFKNRKITKVIVYASSPISKVIGEFEIKTILHQQTIALWENTKEYSGITKEYYLDYFKGKSEGYAIEIANPILYEEPISIEQFGIKAPQSFGYINKARRNNIV